MCWLGCAFRLLLCWRGCCCTAGNMPSRAGPPAPRPPAPRTHANPLACAWPPVLRRYGHAHTSQSLPRMLTLWFDFGTYLMAFKSNKGGHVSDDWPCCHRDAAAARSSWAADLSLTNAADWPPRCPPSGAAPRREASGGHHHAAGAPLLPCGTVLAACCHAHDACASNQTSTAKVSPLLWPTGGGHHDQPGQERAHAHVAGGAASAHLPHVPPLQGGQRAGQARHRAHHAGGGGGAWIGWLG